MATLLYAVALWWVYRTIIVDAFAYAGYTYRTPHPIAGTITVAITVAVALMLPRKITKPSHFVLWILFVVLAAPSILVPQYTQYLPVWETTVMGAMVAASFTFARLLAHHGPTKSVPLVRLPGGAFWGGLMVVSALVYGYLIAVSGLDFRLVSILDVYDIRADFRETAGTSAILGYVIRWQFNIINPIFIARGVYSGRWFLIAVGLLGQVVIYAGTGFKSVIFSTPAIILVALIFRRGRPPGSHIVLVTALGVLATAFLDWLAGSIIWSSLFVRRFLIVPGVLSASYVATFSEMPKTWFADSIFPFLEYPYDVGASFIVGGGTTAANSGLFGHGYLNAGYLGMFIECGVLAILLWLIDSSCRGVPVAVSSLIFLMPAINLSNGSVFTAVLTHGVAAGVVACAALPRTGWGRRQPKMRPRSRRAI